MGLKSINMKTKKIFVLVLFLTLVSFYNCGDDNTVAPTNNSGDGITQSITSADQGNMSFDGFRLLFPVGSVPHQQNGTAGTVVFSMNSSSSLPSGLVSLPSGFSQVGKFLQAGPDNFVFSSTIKIFMPAGSESSTSGLGILGYFPEENGWKIIPSNIKTDSTTGAHYLVIDVLKLGYFVMARGSLFDNPQFSPQGGVQWCNNDGLTFVILTVKSVIFAEPEVAGLIAGGMVGRTFISPNIPGMPFPSDYCRGIVPLGTYEFWVSFRTWNSDDIQTYSLPVPVTVSSSLHWPLGWVYTDGDGWTIFGCQLPAGGTMLPGRPTAWPPASVPYGSGTVQATLTWNNSSGTEADMDLHLYGPNNIHVYWQNPTSTNFSLDRDWQSADGDAVENIFSTTTTIPSGTYRINVAHFSGAAKSFNCRVVVNGSVTNYSGNLQDASVDVRTFTVQ